MHYNIVMPLVLFGIVAGVGLFAWYIWILSNLLAGNYTRQEHKKLLFWHTVGLVVLILLSGFLAPVSK